MSENVPVGISSRDSRALFSRAGNRCAFEECRRLLVSTDAKGDLVVLGEIAHIVAEHDNGPRADPGMPVAERNAYANLLLLCNVHHQLIDDRPDAWSVERLRAIKAAHERWVEERLPGTAEPLQVPSVKDVLFSTALPVIHVPPYVYSAPVPIDEAAIRGRTSPKSSEDNAAFIVREQRLLAFHDLRRHGNAFATFVDPSAVERHDAFGWFDDPDRSRWYVDLLNRALSRHCRRRGLSFDREHRRFYFAADQEEVRREVRYKPMNRSSALRDVVWRPVRRSTGESRPYWLHGAATLRFAQVRRGSWMLTIRPGLHVTVDGFVPPPSETIGRRVTRRLNRMFNYELLKEVQFWRDVLGEGKPRIVLAFGQPAHDQNVQISTELLATEVDWPGLPPQYARSFSNVGYEEGLFSWGDLNALAIGTDEIDDDFDESEVDT